MASFRTAGLCIAAPALAIIVVMTRAGDRPDEPPPEASGVTPGPGTLAGAVAVTRAATSGRVELETTVPGPTGPVSLVHRAAFAGGGARAQASSDLSQVAAALDAAGRRLDGDWTQPTGVVVDGGTVYSQLGPMAEALGRAPDDWVSAPLPDVAGSGAVADNDTLALALDPLGSLDLLLRPVVEIGSVGRDDVGGTAAEHLRASLDLTGGEGGPPAPGSFEGRLLAAGLDRLPVDVWVDAAGAVRRFELTVDGAGSLTTRFDAYDLGADVEVEVPDPEDVISPATGGPPTGGTAGTGG
ncbi:MAG TPA: hypothetical protein VFZ77_24170 [Acidimicrobiales bacterium]